MSQVRCNGSDITTITLGQLNLEGGIPASLSNLTALEVLELGFNRFSGTLPSYVY